MVETSPTAQPTPKLKAILGRKLGMTQIFDAQGLSRPATELEAGPCPIVDLRTKEKDGYAAVVLGFCAVAEKSVNKPQLGVFKKAGLTPFSWLREVRVAESTAFKQGDIVTLNSFEAGDYVDVAGVSKGKGFAGGVK